MVSPDGNVRDLNHADGLVWDDISPTGVREETDGSYMIATSRGLARFAPTSALSDAAPPAVAFTGVSVGGHDEMARTASKSVTTRARSRHSSRR